jgi:hypothetical protein
VQVQLSNLNVAGTDFRHSLSDFHRASWHDLSTGKYFNVTGSDQDLQYRAGYSANLRAGGSYTLRWNHPTPKQISLSLNGAYNGAWAVLAIPYPADTTFTIVTGYRYSSKTIVCGNAPSYTILTPVDSLDKLRKYNYYWDNSHLYIRLENFDNLSTEELGFSWESSYGATVAVTASCTTCDVSGVMGGSPVPALPSPYTDTSDKYEVTSNAQRALTLKVGLVESSCIAGHGFFSWDTTTHILYYTIHHNIGAEEAVASISTGEVTIALPSGLTPIRGYLSLSHDKQVSVYNGKFSVQICTNSNPSRLSGSIGCVGTCSKPPKVPQGDMCTVAGSSIVLYDDSLQNGWVSVSAGAGLFGSIANYSWASDSYCGNKSIDGAWDSTSALILYNYNKFPINTTVYTHLEFFMKYTGPSVPFWVNFNGGTVQAPTDSDIVNFVVEDSWTRVRIPLARYSLTAPITSFGIIGYYSTPTMRVSFDNISFVTADAVDTLVDSVTGDAVAYQSPVNSKKF